MKSFKHLFLIILSAFLMLNYSFVDIYAEDNEILYKTCYYKENSSGTDYQLISSEIEDNYAAIGETVTAHIKKFPGFVLDTSNPNSKLSGVIIKDDAPQLNVYYKRETHSVYFKDGDKTIKQYDNVKYGTYLSSLKDIPTNTPKTGYKFNSWDANLYQTMVTYSDMIINANYSKNYYFVRIDVDNGVLSGVDSTEYYDYGEEFTINHPIKAGFQFAGWEITGMDNCEHYFDGVKSTDTSITTFATRFKNLTSVDQSKIYFKALWTPNPVKCVVNHYQMNDTGTAYELVESENIAGEVGSVINVDNYKKSYLGFEYKGGKGNNSSPTSLQTSFNETVTVTQTDVYNINLYYSRNKHVFTLITGEGLTDITINNSTISAGVVPGTTFEVGKEIKNEFYYGEDIGLSCFPLNQNAQTYWTKDNNLVHISEMFDLFKFKMGDSDITYTVSSKKPSGNSYVIMHYLEDLDGKNYTESFDDRDVIYGQAGTSITAVSKNFYGYSYDSTNSNNLVSGTITDDDKLELKLYYKRNTHNVFFVNGEDAKKIENVKYGTTVLDLEGKPNPTKTGYTFAGWNVGPYFKTEDCDAYVYPVFNANKYKISYELKSGTPGSNQPTDVTYDQQFTVDNPTRKGYIFTGWKITGMDTNQHAIGTATSKNTEATTSVTVFKNLNATGGAKVTFTATWTEDKIPYTVRHYQMDIDGTSYSLKSIETLDGLVDSKININNLKKTYTGFTYEGGNAGSTASNVKGESFDTEATLEVDTPLVINLFYERKKNNVTVSGGVGITATFGGGEYYYGDTVYVSANFKDKYSFLNWTNNTTSMSSNCIYSFEMPDSAVTLKANAFTGEGSEYKIEHYTENLENTSYTVTNTEDMIAPAGTTVTANDKLFTGFTFDSSNSNNKLSGVVQEDGSLVLKLYYKRNTHSVTFTDGNSNTLKKIENVKYGTTISKLTGIPANPARIGYTFVKWDKDLANTTLPDNDLTISAEFDANKYKISYVLNSGTPGSSQPTDVTYDQQFTVDNPTRPGYKFDGWEITGMDTNPHVIGAETTTVNTTTTSATKFLNLNATKNAVVSFAAKWTEKPIGYIVNHYLMATDGLLYVIESIEKPESTAGTEIIIDDLKKTYTGFTYLGGKASDQTSFFVPENFDTTATIELDKTLVINLYYSRNQSVITLNCDDGISDFVGDGEHYYGEKVQISANVKPGYTFLNWTNDSTGASVSNSNIYEYIVGIDNVTFTANTTANTNTHYIVKHMQQDVDGSNYVVKDSEELTGTTNTEITPNVKTYVGFTSPDTQTATINGDGTTVIEYKYDRHSYEVNFDGDDATSGSIAPHSIKFGQAYTMPNNPFVKTNNTFLRWKMTKFEDTSYYIGSTFAITETFVTTHDLKNGDSLSFKACWESNEPETEIKDTDFKAGEVKQVESNKTEFNMKLSSDSLKKVIGGNVAAAGSVVWLESKKSDDNDLKKSTKTIIEEKANLDCEIKECLDIKLFSQNKGEESKNVKDLASAVEITFKLETQENIDAAKAGKLVIYSIHDGVLDPNMIVGKFNESTNEYTFDTNKFSIFALTYLPNGIPKPAGENDDTGKSQNSQSNFVPPNTGIY